MAEDKPIALGQSIKRMDALGKVTGETQYPGDINMDGQWWMKIRFSDRVHARVVSVDTTAAEALPGVHAVFTAEDVPVNEYGLVYKDQPVLCGPGSSKLGTDVVRCYMDMIAVVVADTEAIAAEAARLVDVTYEDLPIVASAEQALQPDQTQIHPDYAGNVLCHYRIRTGDMDAAWAQADVIVEGEYHTGWQEHAYLQPEAGLSYIDEEGRVAVIVAGQWVHEDQEQVCHALDLPPEQVRIIYPAVGGAFGGREDMSVQIVLALAALRLRHPIKIQWSREESMLYHHKRHPISIKARWGATCDGMLVAAEATVTGDAGPYNYTSTKVMGNAHLMVTGPYMIPNCHIDSYGVITNNIPSGAFRGFGAPQGLFAAEGQMNKLADALGIDPLELRLKNCLREGSLMTVGTPVPTGVSIAQVLEACGRESFWQVDAEGHWQRVPSSHNGSKPWIRRGVGMAAGLKNIGFSFGYPENSWATVELRGKVEIEEVIVRQAGAEVGQGAHTAFVQMAAQAVGVPIERVKLLTHDTAQTDTSGSASASRLTFMAGNAILGAAQQALKKWQDEERPAIATYQYRPPKTTMLDPQTGHGQPNFTFGYVAQAVEVEVDIETGHIHLTKVVSTHDVGKAVNPELIVGQIEGGVVQAHGYAIMENLQSVNGRIINPYFSTYLIPTVLDVPTEVKSVILECADPLGPWGVRGMAEMPMLTLAPAIAAAVYDAIGVWLDALPMIPDRVVAALREHQVGIL